MRMSVIQRLFSRGHIFNMMYITICIFYTMAVLNLMNFSWGKITNLIRFIQMGKRVCTRNEMDKEVAIRLMDNLGLKKGNYINELYMYFILFLLTDNVI